MHIEELKEKNARKATKKLGDDRNEDLRRDPPEDDGEDYAMSLLTTASWHAPAMTAADVRKTMEQQQQSKFAAVPVRQKSNEKQIEENESDSDSDDLHNPAFSWRSKGI